MMTRTQTRNNNKIKISDRDKKDSKRYEPILKSNERNKPIKTCANLSLNKPSADLSLNKMNANLSPNKPSTYINSSLKESLIKTWQTKFNEYLSLLYNNKNAIHQSYISLHPLKSGCAVGNRPLSILCSERHSDPRVKPNPSDPRVKPNPSELRATFTGKLAKTCSEQLTDLKQFVEDLNKNTSPPYSIISFTVIGATGFGCVIVHDAYLLDEFQKGILLAYSNEVKKLYQTIKPGKYIELNITYSGCEGVGCICYCDNRVAPMSVGEFDQVIDVFKQATYNILTIPDNILQNARQKCLLN